MDVTTLVIFLLAYGLGVAAYYLARNWIPEWAAQLVGAVFAAIVFVGLPRLLAG